MGLFREQDVDLLRVEVQSDGRRVRARSCVELPVRISSVSKEISQGKHCAFRREVGKVRAMVLPDGESDALGDLPSGENGGSDLHVKVAHDHEKLGAREAESARLGGEVHERLDERRPADVMQETSQEGAVHVQPAHAGDFSSPQSAEERVAEDVANLLLVPPDLERACLARDEDGDFAERSNPEPAHGLLERGDGGAPRVHRGVRVAEDVSRKGRVPAEDIGQEASVAVRSLELEPHALGNLGQDGQLQAQKRAGRAETRDVGSARVRDLVVDP